MAIHESSGGAAGTVETLRQQGAGRIERGGRGERDDERARSFEEGAPREALARERGASVGRQPRPHPAAPFA